MSNSVTVSTNGWREPLSTAGLSNGDIAILETPCQQPIAISFRKGAPNYTNHLAVIGQTGMGKSCLASIIASGAAAHHGTLIVDPNKGFRNIQNVACAQTILRVESLRLNPWDGVAGVAPALVDHLVNHQICASYNLIFAEYELSEATRQLRARGEVPNLTLLIDEIKRQNTKYFSRRNQYRESLLLILSG